MIMEPCGPKVAQSNLNLNTIFIFPDFFFQVYKALGQNSPILLNPPMSTRFLFAPVYNRQRVPTRLLILSDSAASTYSVSATIVGKQYVNMIV